MDLELVGTLKSSFVTKLKKFKLVTSIIGKDKVISIYFGTLSMYS